MPATPALQTFKNLIGIKFQLYNSLFTSLPFHRIEKTGILVSMLLLNCEEGYKKKKSPSEIIDEFFVQQTNLKTEQEKIDMLFRFVQYIERQVVLFDALEDAAFKEVNDMGGTGTLKHLALEVGQKHTEEKLTQNLNDFSIQLVLTAHPTQFYRGAVLGIIHDLSSAINGNNENEIYTYLQQLGRTPFFQHEKPTPFDEAVSLVWYLENIFYKAAGKINSFIKTSFPDAPNGKPIIKMGFWPGGDRDGNPFVNALTTLQVAKALNRSIVKCYYKDVRNLKRRLTFKGVDVAIATLEKQLHSNLYDADARMLSVADIIKTLTNIRHQLVYEHSSLFVSLVEDLINKIELFGLHFATLDIRQDSGVHTKLIETIVSKTNLLPKNYTQLSTPEKVKALISVNEKIDLSVITDPIQKDVIESIQSIKEIHQLSGEAGCNRYIISHNESALNVIEVFGLFLLSGWEKEEINVDIVPLFEMIEDLQNAEAVMKELYENKVYSEHLKRRGNKQTIMLGFSDGTKDGGYLMANWSIFKAKQALTAISKQYEIDVVFFDGRGGPPARGGGKTHQFYASMGNDISRKEIQLTIQGQTVSSNFGTVDSAQFNIEQLLNAGLGNNTLKEESKPTLKNEEEELLQLLSEISYHAYKSLKEHPYFLEYLIHASPLRFYAETNIGSRPTKRGSGKKLELTDLRAIPFVGAWSQLKQNVTGYYGVGTALRELEKQGKFAQLQSLYKNSLFFKTMIDNCEMAMQKCFFPATAFLGEHKIYGEVWHRLFSEYELTKLYLQRLTGSTELMKDYPVEHLSIQMRERIVLPLVTIQQYALTQIRKAEEKVFQSPQQNSYEKLIMRCSFGIINAGRNSA